MTSLDWKPVATALLGTWPTQIANWGREGIAAYIAELQARGLTPEQALIGIRSQQGPFPPSAGQIADTALRDPGVPTFDEMFKLVFGPRGVLAARPTDSTWPDMASRSHAYDQAALDRAEQLHPLVTKFVRDQGVSRLRMLELDHPEHGEIRRRELREAWDRLCRAHEGRALAAIASGRRDGLRAFDPLAALAPDRPALPTSTQEEH